MPVLIQVLVVTVIAVILLMVSERFYKKILKLSPKAVKRINGIIRKAIWTIFISIILFYAYFLWSFGQSMDVEEFYPKVIATPIDKVSDLIGYTGGFTDFSAMICFKSKDIIELKNEDRFTTEESDSTLTSGRIKYFRSYFKFDIFEDYHELLAKLKSKDVLTKSYYKEGVVDINYMFVKEKGIHFLIYGSY